MPTKYYPVGASPAIDDGAGWEDTTCTIYLGMRYLATGPGTGTGATSHEVANGSVEYDFAINTLKAIPRRTTAADWGVSGGLVTFNVSTDVSAVGSNIQYGWNHNSGTGHGGAFRINGDGTTKISGSGYASFSATWTGTGIQTGTDTAVNMGAGTAPTTEDRLAMEMRIYNSSSMHSNETITILRDDSDTWLEAPWAITDSRTIDPDYMLPNIQIAQLNTAVYPGGGTTYGVTDDDVARIQGDFIYHNPISSATGFIRVGFSTPSGSLDTTTNIQKLRALVYNTTGSTINASLALYEDSSIVSSTGTVGIPAGGSYLLEHSFSVGDLTTASGANVEAMVSVLSTVTSESFRYYTIDWYAPQSSGTTTPQSVAATATVTAAVVLQAKKIVAASSTVTAAEGGKVVGKGVAATSTVTAAEPTKAVTHAIDALTTVTGAIVKQAGKAVDATSTVTAAIATSMLFMQAVDALTTVTAAVQSQVGKAVDATTTVTADVVKQAGKAVDATTTVAVGRVLQVGKLVAASSTVTAALDTTKVIFQTIAAATTVTAAIVKQAGISIAATTTVTVAEPVKAVGKAVAATVTATPAVQKAVSITVAASSTVTAALNAMLVFLQDVFATTTVTPAITRQVGKVVAATTTLTGAITRQVGKLMDRPVFAGVTLNIRQPKHVDATTTVLPDLVAGLSLSQQLDATTTITVGQALQVGKDIAANTTITPAIVKSALVNLVATTATTANLSKQAQVDLAATVLLGVVLTPGVTRAQAVDALTSVTAALDTLFIPGGGGPPEASDIVKAFVQKIKGG